MGKYGFDSAKEMRERTEAEIAKRKKAELISLGAERVNEARAMIQALVLPHCMDAADRCKKSRGIELPHNVEVSTGERLVDSEKALRAMCLMLEVEGYATTLHRKHGKCVLQVTW